MYCINLKKKSKQGKAYIFCKRLNKEITFEQCRSCIYKEYKKYSTLCKSNKKYDKMHNISKKRCKKNKKIVFLEKHRKSVLTDNLDLCIVCGKPKQHLHEVFYGKNRTNSMKYDMVIPLCVDCHTGTNGIHFNNELDLFYKIECQKYFEKNIGNRKQFISIFGRSYY